MSSTNQITARMPIVTLTELLCEQIEPPLPDPDTFDPPTNPRQRCFARGTEQQLPRIDPDEPWIHPSRLPTEKMFAAEPPDFDPLDDDEVATALAPLSRL